MATHRLPRSPVSSMRTLSRTRLDGRSKQHQRRHGGPLILSLHLSVCVLLQHRKGWVPSVISGPPKRGSQNASRAARCARIADFPRLHPVVDRVARDLALVADLIDCQMLPINHLESPRCLHARQTDPRPHLTTRGRHTGRLSGVRSRLLADGADHRYFAGMALQTRLQTPQRKPIRNVSICEGSSFLQNGQSRPSVEA